MKMIHLMVLATCLCVFSCAAKAAEPGKLRASVTTSDIKSRHALRLSVEEKAIGPKRKPSTFLEHEPVCYFFVGDGTLAVDTSSAFNTCMQLGSQAMAEHRFTVAETNFKKAIEVSSRSDKSERAKALMKLGMTHLLMDKRDIADKELNDAACGMVGKKRDFDLGTTFFHLGLAAYERKKFLWAAENFLQSVLALQSVPEGKHWVPQSETYLANCLYELDRFGQADDVYRQAEIAARKDPELKALVSTIISNRALCARTRGRTTDCEKRLLDAVAFATQNCDVLEQVDTTKELCDFYDKQKRYDDAIARCQSLLPRLSALPEGSRSKRAEVLNDLAYYHFVVGKLKESVRYYKQTSDVYASTGEPGLSAEAASNLADVLCNQNEYKKAIPFYEQLLNYQSKSKGAASSGTLEPRNRIAMCYLSLGDYKTAEALLKQNLSAAKTAGWKAYVLCSLGHLYRLQKIWDKASISYNNALQEYRSANGDQGSHISAVKKFIELNEKHDVSLDKK